MGSAPSYTTDRDHRRRGPGKGLGGEAPGTALGLRPRAVPGYYVSPILIVARVPP